MNRENITTTNEIIQLLYRPWNPISYSSKTTSSPFMLLRRNTAAIVDISTKNLGSRFSKTFLDIWKRGSPDRFNLLTNIRIALTSSPLAHTAYHPHSSLLSPSLLLCNVSLFTSILSHMNNPFSLPPQIWHRPHLLPFVRSVPPLVSNLFFLPPHSLISSFSNTLSLLLYFSSHTFQSIDSALVHPKLFTINPFLVQTLEHQLRSEALNAM